jgi:hypothetical protein
MQVAIAKQDTMKNPEWVTSINTTPSGFERSQLIIYFYKYTSLSGFSILLIQTKIRRILVALYFELNTFFNHK